MNIARSHHVVAALTTALLFTSSMVLANDAYILYRQQVMSAVGGHAGAIGSIVKSRLPELDAIVTHAEAIATTADTVPNAFEKQLHEGATDSKPEIWTNMEDFLSLNEEMRKASVALAQAAKGGDGAVIKKAMREFSKSCGACHRAYRKPKEESYKQRR